MTCPLTSQIVKINQGNLVSVVHHFQVYWPLPFKWLRQLTIAAEGSIQSAQQFLRTSQSASFGTYIRDCGQNLTYTCINTYL